MTIKQDLAILKEKVIQMGAELNIIETIVERMITDADTESVVSENTLRKELQRQKREYDGKIIHEELVLLEKIILSPNQELCEIFHLSNNPLCGEYYHQDVSCDNCPLAGEPIYHMDKVIGHICGSEIAIELQDQIRHLLVFYEQGRRGVELKMQEIKVIEAANKFHQELLKMNCAEDKKEGCND